MMQVCVQRVEDDAAEEVEEEHGFVRSCCNEGNMGSGWIGACEWFMRYDANGLSEFSLCRITLFVSNKKSSVIADHRQ